jgi:ferritin-like metal-binding protein YciE
MGLGSLKDLYFDELGTLYDAELHLIRALPRISEAAFSPELRETLSRQCGESRMHLERIDLIFTHWGERRPLRSSAGLAGIVQEADERLNQETTPEARDAAIVGLVQRMNHYQIAGYSSVRGCALRLNRWDEARLLQETLDEEERSEGRLTAIAESHLEEHARAAAAFAGPIGDHDLQ